MKLKNLCPHEITIFLDKEPTALLVLEPEPVPARCSVARVKVGSIEPPDTLPISVYHTVFGEVEDLPDPEDGVTYIVSRVVAEKCPERRDLVYVDDTVRDKSDRVLGCRALAVVW